MSEPFPEGLPYVDCEGCGAIVPVGSRCKCGARAPEYVPSLEEIEAASAAALERRAARERLFRDRDHHSARHHSIRQYRRQQHGPTGPCNFIEEV